MAMVRPKEIGLKMITLARININTPKNTFNPLFYELENPSIIKLKP